jgi:hypothetical protein
MELSDNEKIALRFLASECILNENNTSNIHYLSVSSENHGIFQKFEENGLVISRHSEFTPNLYRYKLTEEGWGQLVEVCS